MSNAKTYKEEWAEIAQISGGGQGTTIRARSTTKENFSGVVKILKSQNDDERRARMYREAATLETLSHPNLPLYLDSNAQHFRDKEYKLFIVTEFIPGPTLSEFDFSTIQLEQKILVAKRILEVINYCHQRGIIHRDIKPDNIILKNGDLTFPVLIDFGLSFNNEDKDNDTLTSDGQHLGNRFLILPEQKVGEAGKRDFRSDITCAVGIFFFVLTGMMPTVPSDEYNQHPHQRKEAKDIIDRYPQHQKEIINYIFDVGFNTVIDRRWQSVQGLIEQLEYLEQSKPVDMNTSQDYINNIKAKLATQDYQDSKVIRSILQEIDKQARLAVSELNDQLGQDWGITQGDYSLTNDEYKNRLVPHNAIKNYTDNTMIHGFITGSELVVQLIDNGARKEIFRQPLMSEKNWDQFREALKLHYLENIHKVL